MTIASWSFVISCHSSIKHAHTGKRNGSLGASLSSITMGAQTHNHQHISSFYRYVMSTVWWRDTPNLHINKIHHSNDFLLNSIKFSAVKIIWLSRNPHDDRVFMNPIMFSDGCRTGLCQEAHKLWGVSTTTANGYYSLTYLLESKIWTSYYGV